MEIIEPLFLKRKSYKWHELKACDIIDLGEF